MKKIMIEDFARPTHRDTSVLFSWPLLRQTASGFPDSRGILPAYRSLRLKIPYDVKHPGTYLLIKAHGAETLPSGSLRVYGWRDPQPPVNFKNTVQYKRVDGFDWIDLEPSKLGGFGSESVFALSVADRWRWMQLACFWPCLSVSVMLSENPMTNVIKPANVYEEATPLDDFITDDFQDRI
jgi:hypothetical protein